MWGWPLQQCPTHPPWKVSKMDYNQLPVSLLAEENTVFNYNKRRSKKWPLTAWRAKCPVQKPCSRCTPMCLMIGSNNYQNLDYFHQTVTYGPAALLLSCAHIWKFPPKIPLLCSSLAGEKQLIVFSIFFFSPAEEEHSRGILGGTFQTRTHDGNNAAGP